MKPVGHRNHKPKQDCSKQTGSESKDRVSAYHNEVLPGYHSIGVSISLFKQGIITIIINNNKEQREDF